MQRTLPLLILAVILTAVVSLWLLDLLDTAKDGTPAGTGPQPGDILYRQDLPQVERPRTDFAPWEVLLPGLPFPPPTTDDSLIWTSDLEIHFPYIPEPTWTLRVLEENTGFPLPNALVLIGPRGLLEWQQEAFPEGNLEGLLQNNGLAFRTDSEGHLRIPQTWAGLPIGVRYGDNWGSGSIVPPPVGGAILHFVAEDRGILVRVHGPDGAAGEVPVGMFVSSNGKTDLVRQAKTDANGFAWLLHATDPGIRRDPDATWWVDLMDGDTQTPELTYSFDLLPLRTILNPDPGPKPDSEPLPFYPLGVNSLED